MARELYMLRRYFGIGAHEAEHVLPAWEVDMLLDQLTQDLSSEGG